MRIKSAANAACVREEIVCISPLFYHSPYLDIDMSLMRAQAAFAAVARGGQFVLTSTYGLLAGAVSAIPQRHVTRNWP